MNQSKKQLTPTAFSFVFGLTILLSASLLFLVQPLVSKLILPWFGGSAAVWLTAMLFFQSCLLVGYLYAHILVRYVPDRWQSVVHICLLLGSVLLLPISPSATWHDKFAEDPILGVFSVLGASVGLPYVLLSSTSPLLQSWFSRCRQGTLPYRYFALSNAGSLAALFAFPLLIEPRFTGRQQRYLWSWTFVVFAFLGWACSLLQLRHRVQSPEFAVTEKTRVSISSLLLWIALATCPSALLLIVTNLLTQNIAPMPLLWVVPLGIYLLTFILCFESANWYRRWVYLSLVPPALAFIATTTRWAEDADIFKVIPLLLASFFVALMACHGELARLKPVPALLTSYYLAIAAGGALGGLLVAFIAPKLFNTNYEYPLVLSALPLVLLAGLWRERDGWKRPRLYQWLWLGGFALTVGVSVYSIQEFRSNLIETRLLVRNFYGSLRIDEFDDDVHRRVRQLNHGTITHGNEFINSPLSQSPTTYYGRNSGVGLSFQILSQGGPVNMGVIGLGTGTLAAYGRGGDRLQFYEINPAVVDIAKREFHYLSGSPAHIDIALGDARLTLEKQPRQHFDLLVVDAFSGDSIPVHLLTAQACHLYWDHLRPDGILAVHISNRYLHLAPIVKAAADNLGFQSRLVSNADDDQTGVFASDYVLVTNRKDFFENPLISGQAVPITQTAGIRLWTDDYSNIWQCLQFHFSPPTS